jgi:hypothetical protein
MSSFDDKIDIVSYKTIARIIYPVITGATKTLTREIHMKTVIIFLSLLCSNLTFATSLRPCTPSVQAKPTRIFCKDKGLSYSIVVNTLVSPAQCTGQNHFEYKTAKVNVTNKAGQAVNEIEILEGDFDYSLQTGHVEFNSSINGLKLKKCVTPAFGGFSIGN